MSIRFNMSLNQIICQTIDCTCLPYPLGCCPPLSHPPLPRFPCTRCLSERSRAIVIQYCQTWRRIYNPSGFLVSLLPGVTGLLGMDASSSLSTYPHKENVSSHFCPFLLRTKSPCNNERLFPPLSTARKPRVQPGCIQ